MCGLDFPHNAESFYVNFKTSLFTCVKSYVLFSIIFSVENIPLGFSGDFMLKMPRNSLKTEISLKTLVTHSVNFQNVLKYFVKMVLFLRNILKVV